MKSKYIPIIALTVLVLSVGVLRGQHRNAYPETERGDLKAMKASPEAYDRIERTDIYLAHIGRHFGSSNDSARILLHEMVNFGLQIGCSYMAGTAYTSLAELVKMTGSYQEAIPLYRKAVPLLKQYPREYGVTLGSLGNVYVMANDLDSAEICMNVGMEALYVSKDTGYFAHAHIQKGNLFMHQERYYSAIDQYHEALKFVDQAETYAKRGNVYRDIAAVYHILGDRENAIGYATQALEIAEGLDLAGFRSEMNARLGAYYKSSGDYDQALACLGLARIYQEEKRDYNNLLRNYALTALIYLTLDQQATAAEYLDKGTGILSFVKSERFTPMYYQALGEMEHLQGNYTASERAFDHLVTLGRHSSNPGRMSNGYSGLVKNARVRGAWRRAAIYTDSILIMRKQMDLANQQRLVYDLETRYETDLKNAEIAQLNAENETQQVLLAARNRQLLYLIAGLILAVLGFLGFYSAFRTKNRANKALGQKNQQLTEALDANKMLVKEIHHRVKNNLQVVSSLLSLQSRFEKDDTIIKAINTGKFRVQSMSLLHQNLYVNEDLNSIKVRKYFEDLADSIIEGYPLVGRTVVLKKDIDDIQLDVDTVVPLGLITNELLTNALKYAFRERNEGMLEVSLKEVRDKIRLIVRDNGVGIGFTEIPKRSTSMGMQLISSFAHKLKADIEIDNFNGTEFKLTFDRPASDSKLERLRHAAS